MSIGIGTWQSIYGTVFPILGLAILLFGIWWTRPKKMVPNGQRQEKSDKSIRLIEQMSEAIQRDIGNLPLCVKVCNLGIDWRHLADTDSYFELNFDVYSSSVFKIDIGKRIDGHLRYGKEEFERSLEVKKPIEQLKRGDERRLTLRQWVSQSMMNRIAIDGGNEIVLDFSTVNISVDANLSDGEQCPNCSLVVPNQFPTRLSTRGEVENQ